MVLQFVKNFNSIKVRLGLAMQQNKFKQQLLDFNSIKVRLEQKFAYLGSIHMPNFNSIKVRLELLTSSVSFTLFDYFNSIKVRLERLSVHFVVVSPISIP